METAALMATLDKKLELFNCVANGGSTEYPESHKELYQNLVLEEAKEVQECTENTSVDDESDGYAASAKFIKELCDLHYVSGFSLHLEPHNVSAMAHYCLVSNMVDEIGQGVYTECFNEVHRSNMSKFVKVSDYSNEESTKIVTETLDKHLEEGRYQGVHVNNVVVDGETYLVFKDVNGKVLKPTTYSDANLSSIIPGYLSDCA